MGKVLWNKAEIPQPEGAHIDKTDGRVFVYLDEGKPIRQSRKVTVGHATSATMMHPNEKFRQMYPELWERHYGEKEQIRHVMHSGLYATVLGIGWETGLYPILNHIYGPKDANTIMDYAIYSIAHHSCVAQTFSERMRDEVLFSERLPDESGLSSLFAHGMAEETNFRFRDAWARQCVARGLKKVWLSIDGSNNDCAADVPGLAEAGKSKSGGSTSIVSYMYAVGAEDGLPVTYLAYNGGKVDSKAFQTMISYLKSLDVEVEGIILDRGFCSHEVISTLDSLGYPYIVMLKSNTEGHVAMMKEYWEELRWNVKNLVGRDALFGISDRKRLFHNHGEEACVTLFFDGKNGSERAITLLNKVLAAVKKAQDDFSAGKSPAIPEQIRRYVDMTSGADGLEIKLDYDALQQGVDGKGFSSIASSLPLPPAEVNRLYHLRDVSETQYMILKSQLGSSVTRVHTGDGILGKLAACFIAAVIRSRFMNACKAKGLSSNKMLLEMDRMMFLLDGNGLYSAIHDESARQKDILGQFDILPDDLNAVCAEFNQRQGNPVHSQLREKPAHSAKPRIRRGRPAGTGCRKKGASTEPASQKRGRGRPKGSLNRKTLERMANSGETMAPAVEKRRPGRPKGSRNKPKQVTLPETQKRGRGRPKGSKNKPKHPARS